jgi:UDP-2,3-diacylglucosamine pyrophosphatase LpxH
LIIKDIIVYFVRGNHDKPDYWITKSYETSNIKFVSDYEVLNLNGKNILCIGGALSVDRLDRRLNFNYWKEEIIDYDISKVENLTGVDIVITHDAPNFCFPVIKSAFFLQRCSVDTELEKDVAISRAYLTNVYNKLKENNNIQSWYYGHFHASHSEIINNTKFKLLNVYEMDILYIE